jgi:nitrite reductase/ring-hydroxylating ferredoxin subunit
LNEIFHSGEVNDTESIPDDSLLTDARRELNGKAEAPQPRPFIYACKLGDIPKNGSRGKVIFCEYDEVALFLIHNTVYAISNICPHQSSPLLSEGHIDKDSLTVACPLHGWAYRLTDGGSVVGDGGIKSYALRIRDNEVWIEEPIPPVQDTYSLE